MAFSFRLDRLELRNFRQFELFSIDFDERLTVLVGNNGSGKSSVLDAASIALDCLCFYLTYRHQSLINQSDARVQLFDLGDTVDAQPQYPVAVTSHGCVGEDAAGLEWTASRNSPDGDMSYSGAQKLMNAADICRQRVQDGDQSLVLPLMAYYGTGRLWGSVTHGAQRRKTFTRLDGYANALGAVIDENQLLTWFFKMTAQDFQRTQSLRIREESAQFAAVRGAVEQCFKAITDSEQVHVTYSFDADDLEIEYIDKAGVDQRLTLSQLSDGYRAVLGMVADIAYRMALLNPMLGKDVLTTPGVVLIDEVDLHLHPLWQARVLGDLLHIFPEVQFIVTTHAPVVISSVRSRHIRVLDNGGEARHLGTEIYGSDAGRALIQVLGAPERPVEVQAQFDEFYKVLDEGDYKQAEQLLDAIKELVGADDTGYVSASTAFVLERDEARYAAD